MMSNVDVESGVTSHDLETVAIFVAPTYDAIMPIWPYPVPPEIRTTVPVYRLSVADALASSVMLEEVPACAMPERMTSVYR